MEVEKRILGWAGLTPHEVEVVRLVFQALGDKLIEDWKLDEHARNDVVIANPLTSHGKGALSEAPSAIAVVDRFGKVPDWIDHHLIRPLRPRALVESMNATCTKPAAEAEPETLKTASESTRKSLAQALHDATTQANPDSVHVIDGIGDAPLIVDAVRNRLCGSYTFVDFERLHDPTPIPVRVMPRADGEAMAGNANGSGGIEFTDFWRTVWRNSDNTPLFGDPETTLVQLVRWPNFSSMQIPRVLFRAAAQARSRGRTASALANDTGIAMSQVISMLNLFWLTGHMQVIGRARSQSGASVRGTRSTLASRIRERLGTV